MMKRIAIASDHAGFALKEILITYLIAKGYELEDLGVNSDIDAVDYPDYGIKAVNSILSKDVEFAIILCGTGIGMSIMANRFSGIRAALCHHECEAELARKHNNANILCLGGRILDQDIAKRCVTMFLNTAFDGGRHQCRLDKIDHCLNEQG